MTLADNRRQHIIAELMTLDFLHSASNAILIRDKSFKES